MATTQLHVPSASSSMYEAPPLRHDASGAERMVGLELEFGGLETTDALGTIRDVLGGKIERLGPTVGHVRGTAFGDFTVELDSTLFKERAYLDALKEMGIDVEQQPAVGKAEELVLRVVKEFVPLEVVSPPIPWSRLAELDPLWARLRERGARGTHASWRFGFGLHLNVQAAELTADYVSAHLKAFLLLEPWLMQAGQTDLARRLGPYIRPFPKEYRNLVLEPDYWPRWSRLVADYLEHSPVRDRPLDVLPLFASVDDAGIRERVEHAHLVRPRPTFHYRLPNCDIDQATWSPAEEWNRWVFVEQVAHDRATLTALCERYGVAQKKLSLTDPWAPELEVWMNELAAAPRAAPAAAAAPP